MNVSTKLISYVQRQNTIKETSDHSDSEQANLFFKSNVTSSARNFSLQEYDLAQDHADCQSYYGDVLTKPSYKKLRKLLQKSGTKYLKWDLETIHHVNKQTDGSIKCVFCDQDLLTLGEKMSEENCRTLVTKSVFKSAKHEHFSRNLHNACILSKLLPQITEAVFYDPLFSKDIDSINTNQCKTNVTGHNKQLSRIKISGEKAPTNSNNIEISRQVEFFENQFGRFWNGRNPYFTPSANVGIFARAWLYCLVKFDKYLNKRMISGDVIDFLVQKSVEVPVSDWERRRNYLIFRLQKDRNPFVDFPELALKIHFHQ